MNNTLTINEKFYEQISSKSYEGLCNMAGNLLLRPNDMIKWHGSEEKFNQRKAAFEAVLEAQYKDTELYRYYHELPKVKHGFCSFERWKLGLLF